MATRDPKTGKFLPTAAPPARRRNPGRSQEDRPQSPAVGTQSQPAAPAVQTRPRLEVRLHRRDPLELPSRLRKAGYRQRLVRMGDSPSETEARIEEMEDLGYRVVRDSKGAPELRRNAIVMEITEELYQARQRAKVEENLRANRAQAEANRQAMNQRLQGMPLPPGAASGVVESTLEVGPQEELLREGEFVTPPGVPGS